MLTFGINKNICVFLCAEKRNGGEERRIQDFGWETGGKVTTWETQELMGGLRILRYTFWKWNVGYGLDRAG